MPPRPAPAWDLVTESFSEAVFLWARWEDAMHSPRHSLDDVVWWVEERLLGALDGVRFGGQRAFDELLVPALQGRRHRPAIVAAHLLTGMGRAGIEHIVAAMIDATPERLDALRRGIECNPGSQWPNVLAEFAPRLPPDAQAAVLDAFGFRRWPSPPGMDARIDRNARAVQLAALRLSGVVRDAWTAAYVDWGLRRSEPDLLAEATLAAFLRGHPKAIERARELVDARAPRSAELLPLVAISRGEKMLPVLHARLKDDDVARGVFDALTCVGTIDAADACASLLEEPKLQRLAADALRAITGLDPTPPAHTVVEPADVPREELLLPTPHPETLREAWAQRRAAMQPRVRHLGGAPFDPASLRTALATTPMRRRHALADELAIAEPAKSRLVTTTWTRVQRAQLAAGAG